jgi:TolA-binding protein
MNRRLAEPPLLLRRRGQGRGGRFSLLLNFRRVAFPAFIVFFLLLGSSVRSPAATAPEKRAFKIAMDFLSSTFYPRAEAEFGDFVSKFPESDLVPEAILRQAQARYFMTNYAGAVELLSGRLGAAGPLSDQYLFLRGEAEFRQSSYPAAADTFARLVHDYPASPLRLQSAVEQAAVYSAMSDWKRVIDLMRDPKGVFQIAATSTNAAASRPPEEDQLIVRGYLMLGEAQFAQGQLREADDTLNQLRGRRIDPVPAWQWQYLLCRIRIAQGRLADALNDCANLVTRAESTGQPGLRADSISFKARLLEKMDRPEEAITTFAENLDLKIAVPPERQHEALLNIASLSIARNHIPEAAQSIERFLAQFPSSPAGDLGWFTLGELRLRQRMDAAALVADGAVTNAPAVTNYLRLSREAFTRVITNWPTSPLRGRAEMNLGWCGWLADDLQASAEGFQGAIEHLPVSLDQARARYKLGDVRFRQNQFKEAESNYLYVAYQYSALPDVVTNLVEPALYQVVNSGLRTNDIPAAYAALTNIFAKFPYGFHSDALLLYGSDISQKGHPEDARSLYAQFLSQTPEAALRPEVELSIARTWEEQYKWAEAVKQYESWLAVFTNHPARPRAEYFHAQALDRVGDTTNALICFTNFIARFPADSYAPRAQWHVGVLYFNQGDLKEAEKQFQLITKGPSDLPYQARLMAGKCAVARQVWKDAADYFKNLYNDTNCPTDLRLESLFAFGDLVVDRSDTTNKISDYEEAIRVFNTIAENYPTNRFAALAWGEKAICLLQWAHKVNQPDALTNVIASFQKVLESPQAGVGARGLARIGIGIVLEKMAEPKSGAEKRDLQERALEYYAEVCFESSVPGEERPDAFCVERAGMEAIRLAEDLQEWQKLSRLCDRLEGLLPSLHDFLLKKKQKAQESLARASL